MFLNNWNEPTNDSRVNLVFENRNKEYGGFLIRKHYNKRVVLSFSITVSSIIILIFCSVVNNFLHKINDLKKLKETEAIILSEPPPIDKLTPPPPPLVIPPPPV